MNYYRRYIGDFQRDTTHLLLIEVGAYDRLLDTQYATARALPVELLALYRICRAISPEEQHAVRAVVEQFFPIIEGGRWNPRARREIAIGLPAIEKMRAAGTVGALKRWGKHRAIDGVGDRAGDRVSDGVSDGVAIHPPTSNLQPPTSSRQPPAASRHALPEGGGADRVIGRATRLPPAWTLPDAWGQWAKENHGWSSEHARKVADHFRDYWIARAGKEARRMDWFAVWRNWCRRETEGRGGNGQAMSRQERIEANNQRAVKEFLEEGKK